MNTVFVQICTEQKVQLVLDPSAMSLWREQWLGEPVQKKKVDWEMSLLLQKLRVMVYTSVLVSAGIDLVFLPVAAVFWIQQEKNTDNMDENTDNMDVSSCC